MSTEEDIERLSHNPPMRRTYTEQHPDAAWSPFDQRWVERDDVFRKRVKDYMVASYSEGTRIERAVRRLKGVYFAIATSHKRGARIDVWMEFWCYLPFVRRRMDRKIWATVDMERSAGADIDVRVRMPWDARAPWEVP